MTLLVELTGKPLDLRPTSNCACSGMGLGTSSMWVKPASLMSALSPPRLPLRSALSLPIVYATMHLAWGLGFLRGAGRP